MHRLRRKGKAAWIAVAAVMGACAVVAAPGCTQTCESECSDEYEDCLARSPPGASKADCAAEYQRCMDICAASDEAGEDQP